MSSNFTGLLCKDKIQFEVLGVTAVNVFGHMGLWLSKFCRQAYSRWLRLDTTFISWWDCLLPSLPWQDNSPGPTDSAAHCLETQISLSIYWILWWAEATGFVLQMGKSMLFAQVPLYIDQLNEICSFQYTVVSFPGWRGWRLYSVMRGHTNVPRFSGRSNSKTPKGHCCLNSNWPASQVPRPNTSLALFCELAALYTFLSAQGQKHSVVFASPSGQMRPEDTLHNG